jgi:hypothetical protein
MHLALLPLDERPVNTRLPADVAAIAGVGVVLPPAAILPAMKKPGDADGLGRWLSDAARDPATAAVVVCIDMLAYGGLIASRTTTDPVDAVLPRLGLLHEVRAARPELPVTAMSLVTRAGDSYSTDEEPDYWGSYGRELHRLGAVLHARFIGDDAVEPPVPDEVRGDFARRRLRNHIVNLAAIDLHHRGVIDTLLLTADDTAARSAGSLEQTWLRHWLRALPARGGVLTHPGADEVGAILVARALAASHPEPVSIAIVCGEPDGLGRVAPYENQPVVDGARGQVAAAGARADESGRRPDAVLVVHAPEPGGGDWCGLVNADADRGPVDRTVATVREALDRGIAVGLADVRYANGGDPQLVDALRDAGLLLDLAAYGGWNTAGNSIGSVVAALVSTVVGRRTGTFNAGAARRLLLHRLLEDWAYQSVVRTRLVVEHGLGINLGGLGHFTERDYAALAEQALRPMLADLEPAARIGPLSLPWHRTFEIDFALTLADNG